MDPIYEKVKANSKFLRIAEEYTNLSGQPTTATMSGANPGTRPTQTQAVDPKVLDANKKAAQAKLTAIMTTRAANKNSQPAQEAEINQLKAIIAGKAS
jgi:hypothetical protein